jgi:hypothetical protein
MYGVDIAAPETESFKMFLYYEMVIIRNCSLFVLHVLTVLASRRLEQEKHQSTSTSTLSSSSSSSSTSRSTRIEDDNSSIDLYPLHGRHKDWLINELQKYGVTWNDFRRLARFGKNRRFSSHTLAKSKDQTFVKNCITCITDHADHYVKLLIPTLDKLSVFFSDNVI